MFRGTVRWGGPQRRSGIAWIDSPPPSRETPVRARLSRSIGLPEALPDILGLALRVTVPEGGTADVEFASTGRIFPLRFALLPVLRAERARFGILLPYRGRQGSVLLSARTLEGGPSSSSWQLVLSTATLRGRWHAFAIVALRRDPDQDDQPRFDAGRRLLPGARTAAWVRAVRQPSYDAVQRSSEESGSPSTERRASQPTCDHGRIEVD